MMKRFNHLTMAGVALLGFLSAGLGVIADDDTERGNQRRERRIEYRVQVVQNWIGVHPIPIDGALKSHLDLSDRVMVASVVPESPAADAGLKKHDILLTFGEHEIKSVENLQQAVAGSEGEKTKVKLLRGGKEMTVDIQPEKRPESVAFAPAAEGFLQPLDRWLRIEGGEGNPFRLRVLGPGIVAGEAVQLPDNLSVKVTKQNDEPAKITIKRGDEKWEVTEETIGELPDDLQPHVKRFLGHRRATAAFAHPPGLTLRAGEDGAIRLPADGRIPEAIGPAVSRQYEEMMRRMQEMQRRMSKEDPFKALREEVEALRREVEKLRGGDSASDSESDGATDA